MSLRVGLLCHRGLGGSARIAVDLGRRLAERDHIVHLFARSAPPGVTHDDPGLHLHVMDHAVRPAVSPKLDAVWTHEELDEFVQLVCRVTVAERLDVLHFHYAVPFAFVLEQVAQRLGERTPALVGTLHGTDVSVFGRRSGMRRRTAAALARMDAVTTVSDSHAQLAVQALGLPRSPLVIPNFVDTENFTPGSRRRGQGDPLRVVHVSNFRPVKQPELMATVFARTSKEVPAELWLVGTGEGMAAVDATIAEHAPSAEVRRHGMRLDVERVLVDADVLLVTSRTESFCLAALEAAACGLPVVAPRVGGLPEVVHDRRTGLLFDPGDVDAAVRSLIRLAREPKLSRRMGRAARAFAGSLAVDSVIPRYEAVYESLLGGVEVPIQVATVAAGR